MNVNYSNNALIHPGKENAVWGDIRWKPNKVIVVHLDYEAIRFKTSNISKFQLDFINPKQQGKKDYISIQNNI